MSSEQETIAELQNRFPKLMRPDQVRKLPNLDAQSKATYENGFQTCWKVMAQAAAQPEGKEFQNALAKLQNATTKVISQYQQWRKDQGLTQAARPQGQQPSGQPSSQASQPSLPSTQPSQPSQAAASAQPTQPSQPAQAAPQQQPNQQTQSAQQNAQPGQRPAQAQPPAQGQQALSGQQQQSQIPPEILKSANAFQVQLPLNMSEGSAEAQKHIQEAKNAYANALVKSHKLAMQVKTFSQEIDRRKMANQEIPLPMLQQKQKVEQDHQNQQKWILEFRAKQNQLKQARDQQRQRQQNGDAQTKTEPGQPPMSAGATQPFDLRLPGPRNPQVARNNSTTETTMTNAATDAARTSISGGRPPMTPTTATSAAPPQQQSLQSQPPHSAGPASATHAPGQAPGPVRPPLNTQQPNISHIAQSPHSANPNGQPVSLSHGAAMAAAARSYSENRTASTPQQPNISTQIPPNYQREQQNKLPISKTFTATPPQPVNIPPGRPTLGGPALSAPGIVGQPAIAKNPHFTIEGEGERVLSRRKLQELVRQVAGGEGAQGEFMTAEVEEAICELADEFIDTVATHACRLAKTRDSHTLEIRDIQTILERNYNIRIPGYAIDDVRTVRKFQPAAAWQAKMNAVQAAKVMGGKTE